MGMIEWLREKFSGGAVTGPVGFTEGIHETGPGAFRRAHGYSEATDPMEATVEIAAHNKLIDDEYTAEIERRKALHAEGKYTPRYYVMEQRYDALRAEWVPELTGEVNWHMEIAMLEGRRVNVTDGVGEQQQAPLGDAEAMELSRMRNKVAYLEGGAAAPQTLADIIGTWDVILDQCGGSEDIANQVVKNACLAFGVSSLGDAVKALA